MTAGPSHEARFVHSRARTARTLADQLAREVGTSKAKDVASRQQLLLNAIEELTVMHGREAADHCTGCGDPYPCITIKRIASVWANDIAFDETMGINDQRL